MSDQRITSFQLNNTQTPYLVEREMNTLKHQRAENIRPYADYCEYVSWPRPKTFKDLSKDTSVQKILEDLYGVVDRVEFYIGLVASTRVFNQLFGPVSFSLRVILI